MPDPLPPQPDPLLPLADAKETSAPSLPPPVPYFVPPRLGIIHLLAWITLSAVFIGTFQSFMQFIEATFGKQAITLHLGSIGINSIAFINIAAELVGMAVILRGRILHQPGRWQPGHFIIVIHACSDVLLIILSLANLYFINLPGTSSSQYLCLIFLVIFWIKTALFLWWWKRSRDFLRWKILFFMEAILTFIMSLIFVFFILMILNVFQPLRFFGILSLLVFVSFLCQLLLAVIYLWITILDFCRGPRRDWVHWLGIATTIFSLVFSALSGRINR
jgi:hypothetical protein